MTTYLEVTNELVQALESALPEWVSRLCRKNFGGLGRADKTAAFS